MNGESIITKSKQDRNFDDIADKLAKNIYNTAKGQLRQAILWQDLSRCLAPEQAIQANILSQQSLLEQTPPNLCYLDKPVTSILRIVDAGGGEGILARQFAAWGHQVIVCDISGQMLQRAKQAAQQAGVAENMQFLHCPLQDLPSRLDSPVDGVLCHAVLEWLAQPQQALQCLSRCLTANGWLSLMFYNYNGLVMRNMTLGNLQSVAAGMPKRKTRSLVPDYPQHPEQVINWLADVSCQVVQASGIRVFHDYIKNIKTLSAEQLSLLFALEQQYCRQQPYLYLGRYVHFLAKKLAV